MENRGTCTVLSGLPVSHLKQFCVGDVMGKSLADKVKKVMWFIIGLLMRKNLVL